MTNTIAAILEVLKLSERLKFELRHSWTSQGRQESVAEHSYQMALMAMLLHPHLQYPVDLSRTLQMVLVHDLVEAEAGDVVFFAAAELQANKAEREQKAIEHLREMLPEPTGVLVYNLWQEFEHGESDEAKFARSLDYLEVAVQHNLAAIATWEPIEYHLALEKPGRRAGHDAFLKTFAETIMAQSAEKIAAAEVRLS